MQYLITALLILNVLAVAFSIKRFCISSTGIQINHIFTFSFGFFFYWILPVAIGEFRMFSSTTAMSLWYMAFDQIQPAVLAGYLASCFACYMAFLSGTVFSRFLGSTARRASSFLHFSTRLLNVYLITGTVASILLVIPLRNQLFRGYTSDIHEQMGALGTILFSSLFLLSLLFIYYSLAQSRGVALTWKKMLGNRYFIIYFFIAFLVLSLGTRLYFVSSLVMLVIYRTVYVERIKMGSFTIFAAIALALSAIVGVVRLGNTVDVANSVFIIFAEPLFTSFSLLGFLSGHDVFPLFHFPELLLRSFINLVPSLILPNKPALLMTPADLGYHVFAPLGALHSYFSFIINFGIIGTMMFMAVMSFILNQMKKRDDLHISKCIYTMISGWLMFNFFRDPFYVSMVKTIFQISIVTPILTYLSLHILNQLLKQKPAAAPLEKPEFSS